MFEDEEEALKVLAKDMMTCEKTPTDMLITIHVKDMACAEVSRGFALRFQDELYQVWHLLDRNGKYHSVKYNMDLSAPTIIEGWTQLREYYGLTGDHHMNLLHYGNSLFLLTVDKSTSLPQTFPKWHSLYHQNPASKTFRVLLTKYKVTCNSLDVPSNMYSYLKEAGFTHINLEDKVVCRIVYNHYKKSAKIGCGWKLWTSMNTLEDGQELTFEFVDPRSDLALVWIN